MVGLFAEPHNTLRISGVPDIGCIFVLFSFLRFRSDTVTAQLPFPDAVIHQIGTHRRAEKTVRREGIDTILHDAHILHVGLHTTRAQPVTVHQLAFPQIHRLHTVGGAQVRRSTGNRHVMDRLALRHVFVVQFTDILHALGGQHIDLSVSVTDQQLTAQLVVMDTRDTLSVQTRLAVVHLHLFADLVDTVQTPV